MERILIDTKVYSLASSGYHAPHGILTLTAPQSKTDKE